MCGRARLAFRVCRSPIIREVRQGADAGLILFPGFYAAGDNASGVQANAGKPGDYRMKAFTDYQWAVDGGYLSAQSCAEYLTK